MMEDWIRITKDKNSLQIELMAGSITVSKWCLVGKLPAPVEIRWGSPYKPTLKDAATFSYWLNVAIALAQEVDAVITSEADFLDIEIQRSSEFDNISIVNRGDFIIIGISDKVELYQ